MSCLKHLVTLSCLSVVVALLLSGCGNNSGGGSGGSSGGDSGSRSYSIGGTVSGLNGSVVLQNNGGDDLTVDADSDFTFATSLNDGESYSVSVRTQPSGQNCTASSNIGTVSGADVTSVSVLCATNPTLAAEAKPAAATLSWNDTGATRYNLYYATEPDCDISNYAGCAGGTMVPNVTSPYTVSGLTNGQNYWFQLEAVVTGDVAARGVVAHAAVAGDESLAVSNVAGTRPDMLVPDGAVTAVAHDATSGVTYIGGQFSRVGLYTGYGVPLSPSTGYPSAFPPVSYSSGAGTVFAAVADGAGGYYIGGVFDTVGGEPRDNLAHILADGTLDAWAPSADNFVSALAVSGGTVYAGGFFTSITDGIGTHARNYLAAIDSNGDVTSWDPHAGNLVSALAVSGSTVYVGGYFTSFGSGAEYSRSRIAAFDTGSLTPDVPTDWDPHASAKVSALAVSGSTVYAGGYFTSFGSSAEYPRNRLAAFDTSSLTPSVPTDWAPSANSPVYTLAVMGSTVYAGGNFTSIDDGSGAQECVYLAAITTDGTLSSWNPAPSDNVYTLAVSGGTVYVGGGFGSVNSESRPYLAAVNEDGTLNSWAPAADGAVNVLALSGSTLYAGGGFSTIDDGGGAQTRNYLAAIGTDGTLDTTWIPAVDSWVNDIAVSGGTVFVGGVFTHVGGGAHGYLAALDATGNLTDWSPSASSTVYDLLVSGNTVYVGGTFASISDTVGGTSGGRSLAAFDATSGNVDPNWNPSASYGSGPGIVHTLAVSGSTVYVGGIITDIDDNQGTSRVCSNLAAIGTDGVLDDTTWIPSTDSTVYALGVSGSTVYAGGYFTTIDDNQGTSRTQNGIAAIGTDGFLSAWDPNANFKVRDLAASDTSVYAGGHLIGGGGTQGYYSALDPAP